MRDGAVRALVKALVRGPWTAGVRLRRLVLRRRGDERWLLAGECGRCAKCCEEPAIRVDLATWYLPTLRRAFLWWQRVVNGFELVGADRRTKVFSFRCTHFDAETRRCDSYATRPGICRDYPRVLLEQAWPEFLEGCGHRAKARGGEKLLVALGTTNLTPEAREELAKRLNLR